VCGAVAKRTKIRQAIRVLNHLRRARPTLGLALGVLFGLAGCRPELDAGQWRCSEGSAGAAPSSTDAVATPWSTGFEDRFCDYIEQAGYCYFHGDASYEIVDSPVHSGRRAAAFRVNTEAGVPDQHARCVRQGTLPRAAYYGAWYYIPAAADTGGKVWNLFHFQGGAGENERLRNLWDVSIISAPNDELQLVVYSPRVPKGFVAEEPIPIPIGRWFQIEMFLKREADDTGEVALYQDGSLLFDAPDMVTEDASFSQWYVGNYSDGMTPPQSILYVDDVSIRAP
jgi:hypothetical protein